MTKTGDTKSVADRRQEAERARWKAQFEAGMVRLLTRLSLLPAAAWLLMLALGAVHGFAPSVPAIGYGTTVLVLVGLDVVAYVANTFRKP